MLDAREHEFGGVASTGFMLDKSGREKSLANRHTTDLSAPRKTRVKLQHVSACVATHAATNAATYLFCKPLLINQHQPQKALQGYMLLFLNLRSYKHSAPTLNRKIHTQPP